MDEIKDTTGYLVADAHGRRLGRVECPMYGRSRTRPDSLAVCGRGPFRRHYVVLAESIHSIDRRGRSVLLTRDQRELQRFL